MNGLNNLIWMAFFCLLGWEYLFGMVKSVGVYGYGE